MSASRQLDLLLKPSVSQRWRVGRSTFRPKGEVIDPREFEVVSLGELEAKAYVVGNHYSGTYPAARWRFGLRRRSALVGAAVFSHPTNDLVLTNVFGGEAKESVELGRFILDQDVAFDGETWFLARCFELLKPEGLRGVVSFSDPMPRRSVLSGEIVMPGHVGTIYQAFNGLYLGRSTASTLRLAANGRVFNKRSVQKVRSKDRGWEYVVRQMIEAGAPPPGDDLRRWVKTWLPKITRPVRHNGNHRFAWAFNRTKELRQRVHQRKKDDPESLAAADAAAEAWWQERSIEWELQQLRDSLPAHLRERPKEVDREPSTTRWLR